jgi:hypothetical protein
VDQAALRIKAFYGTSENAVLCALQASEAGAELAETVNQLILFDI